MLMFKRMMETILTCLVDDDTCLVMQRGDLPDLTVGSKTDESQSNP